MQETKTKTRLEALVKFLGPDCEPTEMSGNLFEHGQAEYLVLTDEEATAAAKDYIRESLWAFNADFIAGYAKIDTRAIKALEKMQSELCEDANDLILALIGGEDRFDEFADDAISADGRGHFMSSYDGNENEQGGFFIYRTN